MSSPESDESTPLLRSDMSSPALVSQPDASPAVFSLPVPPADLKYGALHRALSTRQVQMIAIAGTIGTGLFLGTGRSLAQGGPASMLICYSIVGFVVYVTLLLLGEMATQYPVAGSFNAYATRFFSPSYGFALSWNYWFNDAVSLASDLTAAQLVLDYWNVSHPWIISLVLWVFLVGVNSIHVRAYGEIEYWLASLKIATIVVFVFIGILVNVGVNREHRYIGGENWRIAGAPFVGGFGGFAHVFVTASFAYGGTESLGITAGETRNPTKNMPKVVKAVFWRILLFYILTVLLIGLNVPYTYPNLSNKTTATSPFTIVFAAVGSNVAGSFMNAVILTSVVSAGNHALFAGTRVLYGLACASQAPEFLMRTTPAGVPLFALFGTASISALCFGSSFIGNGQLWSWLQNLVGVSNQIAWLSIGLASWRFRKAWRRQGRSLSEMKFHSKWTWGWGPPFVIITVIALILIQGWDSLFPVFSPVDFVSYYIELPVMLVMYIAWAATHGRDEKTQPTALPLPSSELSAGKKGVLSRWLDTVDTDTVDLRKDEYEELSTDLEEDLEREEHLKGRVRWAWKLYYLIA
ncbi:amino acid permease-domain-containing protein [Vararia minispora EC-137]|uniref:Amino acid permease-domain-containing protein n=1 Tax=Vararia minispora EC-137 TaxID=1314806 RepID=A0ACB8QH84_9AGAM|nr:amino acid permease-domain-containing protein [Vararia minispora EC-137]